MLAFDVGNLILLYVLARRLWNERIAIRTAWVYLALPVALIYTWRTFDSMTTFWMLLAFYWLVNSREDQPLPGRQLFLSAVALGLGVMTKYVPILLLPTVWVQRPIRSALRYSLYVILVVLVILGPFIAASPEFGIASLKAQASKSSWQTVWALIDGNYGTGNVGPDIEHFDPALATKLQGKPERVPSWLTLIPFAAIGFAIFLKTRKAAGQPALPGTFFTLTFALFLLWSKGWSPQWQMMLFPLVLLTFPDRTGILFCVLMGLVSFFEWPVLLSRGMTQWLWIPVVARTVLLLGLAVASARSLRET
jgi:4-amino-4-deoxy-L-arabinose transferase-like glycosyltransferase